VCMIPQYLAFYHWRSRSHSGVLANSVTDEIGRHKFYRQMLLNQWLRADIAAGRFGIGAYANLRGHIEMFAHQAHEREQTPAAVAAPPHGVATAPVAETAPASPERADPATNGAPAASSPAGDRVARALRRARSWAALRLRRVYPSSPTRSP